MTTFANYQSVPSQSPKRSPLTWRMIVLAAIPVCIVGALLYTYLQPAVRDLGNGWKSVDLKSMSDFQFPQDFGTMANIPPQWRELDGKRVVLYGDMYAPNSAGSDSLRSFQLCYSRAKCCFNGVPLVQHFVNAAVPAKVKAYYYDNQVKVTGTLHVQVVQNDNGSKVDHIYSIDVSSLEPAD